MESFGTIVAHVYTSRAQIPVQGATVAVTQKSSEGRHTLLAVRISDINGRIAPIQLPTPGPEAGLSPGGQIPFLQVDLWVEAKGFEMLTIEDLQVFPGTQTIQNLELIPLVEYAPPQNQGVLVQVPPQNL